MKKIFLFSVVALLFLNCSPQDDSTEQSYITPTLISKGFLAGNGEENIAQQNLVIRNSEDWNALKARMNTVNPETDNFSETDIDFTQFQILAVFDEVKNSGGYEIIITDIVENSYNVAATVVHIAPGDLGAAVMTQPYHIVKMPVNPKQVVFN
jgi:hypothetical protein